ncbi:MAG: cytochrome C oxidase subunit I [Rhodospirillaceae bacterium]|jgi:cytochrome c oxidase subunit I|nr:cytochrome C oxidase subunit I [Rhodospirillaceae bacterium]MBT5562075.1 cytochrome C oxidase subunit I [Rhodospirillaceae bacterium]MBT6242248.1 cytochrome C oxidase subunit I [Rhodospirillaceae bacterium]MBT7136280.1 cytochrome C oxidase subunit I [Rhodospirillaceae bacterium]
MAEFRTCPDTGFKIDLNADKLIKWNAVTAVVFLLVGGLFGLLVALTRWPAVHLLDADLFYLALTAHGLDVLLVWCIFFEIALLYFTSAILLNARMVFPKIAWIGYWMMLIGAVITNIAVLRGDSSVMFTSYPPMMAAQDFYLGIILFAVGALLGCLVFFATLHMARKEKTYEGSIPLVTFGAMTAAIIAVFTILSGAIILVPTWFWSLGLLSHIDTIMYRVIWWGMGHSSQQVNVAAQIACWYAIAAILFGAKPLSEKVSRTAFLLYILFLQLASAHHLLVDPGLSSEYKIFNTSYALYLAVLGSMIHGLTVPGAIEAAQRKKGLNKGLFEWLTKAPWGNPVFAGMALSVVLFGFLGGISGVMMGTEQLNLITHNTIYVPGHFHGTVVVGTTLTFMAISYWIVPTLWQKELVFPGLAKWQPYLFGIGMGLAATFMMGAGTLGVPRRHWDMTFADSAMGYDFPAAANLMMGLNGVAAVMGSIGAAIFILNMVGTILWGKAKVPAAAAPAEEAPAEPNVTGAATSYGSAGTMEVPGTFVLAMIFLVSFVLYYFVNWKYLSSVWGLS